MKGHEYNVKQHDYYVSWHDYTIKQHDYNVMWHYYTVKRHNNNVKQHNYTVKQHYYNYLCTCDLYTPVHNVLEAWIYITWGSWRGLGPRIPEFFGPCEMTSSR